MYGNIDEICRKYIYTTDIKYQYFNMASVWTIVIEVQEHNEFDDA